MPTALCIDDNRQSLHIRKLLLEMQGYTVFTADSGHAWKELAVPSLSPAWQVLQGAGQVVVDPITQHAQVAWVEAQPVVASAVAPLSDGSMPPGSVHEGFCFPRLRARWSAARLSS